MLGVDLFARYQKVTDWTAVRARGVGYIWVKLTDGGGRATNPGDGLVAGAHQAGIPVGGYHFAETSPSPEQQAAVFIGEVRRLGATGLVPVLDLETPFKPDAFAQDFGIRFCRAVEAAGFRPGVYMNNGFARALRPDGWGIPGLVIWIARYGAHPDAAAGRYDIHQYSSSGTVPGISAGGVDLNESYTDSHFTSGPAPGSGVAAYYTEDSIMRVPKGGAEGEGTSYTLPASALREHDLVIAPGATPVVVYAVYNWTMRRGEGSGGNPITPGEPYVVDTQEGASWRIPLGTTKIDLVYWADADFSVGVMPV
jgi:lysozyme